MRLDAGDFHLALPPRLSRVGRVGKGGDGFGGEEIRSQLKGLIERNKGGGYNQRLLYFSYIALTGCIITCSSNASLSILSKG